MLRTLTEISGSEPTTTPIPDACPPLQGLRTTPRVAVSASALTIARAESPLLPPIGTLFPHRGLAHSDRARWTDGCCGTAGLFGPNVVCMNGHEVATKIYDCYTLNGIWLLPGATMVIGGV